MGSLSPAWMLLHSWCFEPSQALEVTSGLAQSCMHLSSKSTLVNQVPVNNIPTDGQVILKIKVV